MPGQTQTRTNSDLALNESLSVDPLPPPFELSAWQVPYFEVVAKHPDKKKVFVHFYLWGTKCLLVLESMVRHFEDSGYKVVRKYLHRKAVVKNEDNGNA